MTDYSESAQQNPAAAATGKSLAQLFSTDPLELTEEDREQIITAFRKQRTQFAQESGKKKKASKKKPKAAIEDLGDLDIDI